MHARFHLFLLIVSIPILQRTNKKKVNSIILILLSGLICGFVLSLLIPDAFTFVKSMLNESLAYILSEKLTVGFILYKMSTTLLILAFSQFPVWYFAIKYFKIEKDLLLKREHSLLIAFFVINFIPTILTLRFFPHYFIQALLPASILAGIYFSRRLQTKADIIKPFIKYMFIITIVVIVSSFTFVTLKFIKPDLSTRWRIFWPNAQLIDTINWLKADEAKGKKILVWGDAAEIYYYTRTSSSGVPLWLSVFANNYLNGKRNNPSRYNNSYEHTLIQTIERERMPYFIDTQPNGYSDFERFPLAEFKKLNNDVQRNYYVAGIWKKIII